MSYILIVDDAAIIREPLAASDDSTFPCGRAVAKLVERSHKQAA